MPVIRGAQAATPTEAEPWKSLGFLEGTWDAKAQSGGSGIESGGSYTFKKELGGHILARHSRSASGCKGPADADCDHNDLLYVYQDAPGQPLKAIYFDNEGHVIHYTVSTPTRTNAVFLSDPAPGPRFRLIYELKAAIMFGKFQSQAPGTTEWISYLEWRGAQKK